MSVYSGASIVTDNLFFCLDPSNRKSYDGTENLLKYSQRLNQSGGGANQWGKSAIMVITSDTALAPDGTLTAEKINISSDGIASVHQDAAVSLLANSRYTLSVYARSPNMVANRGFALRVRDGGNTTDVRANFRLDVVNAGTPSILSTGFSDAQTRINYAADSLDGNAMPWYRAELSFTLTSTISNARIELWYSGYLGATTTDGDLFLWGAQLEEKPLAGYYTQTEEVIKTKTTSFTNLRNNAQSPMVGAYNSNTSLYSTPVLELNNNGISNNGQVEVVTQNLNDLALTQNFTVMFAAKKNFFGIGGNNNGVSQLFQGVTSGYTTGWRIIDVNQGTPGAAFSNKHSFSFGYNDINTSLSVNDTGSTNRMSICAFTVSPTTIFGFLNGVTNSISNPLTYASGTSTPRISFTGAGAGSWNGLLGFFALYDRALTTLEIQQNYNALRGRFGL